MKERWIADFSCPEKSCFIIKSEKPYNAYIENSPHGGSLFLGLKNRCCMAWLETVRRVYMDTVINARFRIDSCGSYCAAGIMFRVTGQGDYYLALVSSKGYFRLDAISNAVPRPLIGWTETAAADQAELGIIAKGDHFIFTINGKWVAETQDSSIPGGHFGFALASYDSEESNDPSQESYACKAWLDYLSADSRPGAVHAEYAKWNEAASAGASAGAESRLRLAESFAAVGRYDQAYSQILKAWKHTGARSGQELLFAAQTASRLEKYAEAQKYIDQCLAISGNAEYCMEAMAQKAIILNGAQKYSALAEFLPGYIKLAQSEASAEILPPLHALLGHAYWNLNDFKAAAKAWDKAASLDKTNSLYAAKAREAKGKTAQARTQTKKRGNPA